jgi:hypothetical protein
MLACPSRLRAKKGTALPIFATFVGEISSAGFRNWLTTFQNCDQNWAGVCDFMMRRIAAGSARPPQLNAVQAAEATGPLLGEGATLEVVAYEVESGVSHRPCSRGDLMQGARQRMARLREVLRPQGRGRGFLR